MEQEIWRPVVGYEGLYEVSNMGRVKSLYRSFLRKDNWPMVVNERILKQQHNADGYLCVTLSKDCKGKKFSVHVMVGEVWVEKPAVIDNEKLELNHIDGNKLNCLYSNLEWVSHHDNMEHAWKNNLCKSNSKISKEQLQEIFDLRQRGISYSNISKDVKVSRTHVIQILNGKRLKRKTNELQG